MNKWWDEDEDTISLTAGRTCVRQSWDDLHVCFFSSQPHPINRDQYQHIFQTQTDMNVRFNHGLTLYKKIISYITHTTHDKPYMDRKGRAEVQNSHYIQTDRSHGWVRDQSLFQTGLHPSRGSNESFVGAAGLSQWAVVRHGGEERVPQLTVDEEHDEEDQQEEHQAHHQIRGQVRFVRLPLSQGAPTARGLQEGRHTHGSVGHV